MVKDIGYNVINDVLESWETVRRINNYSKVAGVMLFQRYVNKRDVCNDFDRYEAKTRLYPIYRLLY
jgi:hypothetical protein